MADLGGRILDYRSLIEKASDHRPEPLAQFLLGELPYLWREAYLMMTRRPTDIVRFQHGTFEYIYDDYATLEASGKVPYHPTAEARIVAVIGRSAPRQAARDDYRLRRWVGPTNSMFGSAWDKGHFIAHSIGGAVESLELNVFIQRCDLNRGWSKAGRRFREMEKYCASNAGTLCFNRPVYIDETAKPGFLEFGLLKRVGVMWVECFDNR